MKKIITIALITVLVTAIIGVALATCVNWNPNVFTGYAFTNAHNGTWKCSNVEEKYGYEEVKHMAEEHTVYWLHEGDIDGIGIELVEDELLLVIPTTDKRLTRDMGPYRIWF